MRAWDASAFFILGTGTSTNFSYFFFFIFQEVARLRIEDGKIKHHFPDEPPERQRAAIKVFAVKWVK